MAGQGWIGAGLNVRPALNILLAAGLLGFAAWAVLSAGKGVQAIGAAAVQALWLLPALVALHLVQLLCSSMAWRCLLPQAIPLLRLFRLRIIREGIDSMLPVAQVGGEVVGAQLLVRRGGVTLPASAASIVVDVTVEFLTQLVFLLIGIAALATAVPDRAWESWVGAALLSTAVAGGLLAAQRFGLFRIVEALARAIAARWPGAASLAGMEACAAAIYRRTAGLGRAAGYHLTAWLLGGIESWAVLNALGHPVGHVQALVVEALGMAARSAGFAVPGALVVQETGFALAAAAVGLDQGAGLSLSLVKRVREVVVGLLGLALWWRERARLG